jgi:hypothetical protein
MQAVNAGMLKPESHKGKISLDQDRFFGLDSKSFSQVQIDSKIGLG